MADSPRSFQAVETPTETTAVPAATPAPKTFKDRLKAYYLGIPGIATGAVLGIALGLVLQASSPSDTLIRWIGAPGTLFIRAIKAIVGPLIFCSLVAGMADLLAIGKAGRIGTQTGLLYLFTSLVSACEGMVWVAIFRPMFGNKAKPVEKVVAEFAFQCSEDSGFLTHLANGTIACMGANTTASFPTETIFKVTDINTYFEKTAEEFVERSLTDAVLGQLNAIVTDNITTAFANATLLSIVMFAIPFGIAVAVLPTHSKTVATFFKEATNVFMTMINWVIVTMPIALISLLASSVAGQSDLKMLVSDVGVYVLCDLLCLFVHAYGFYPLLLRTFVKGNPYKWIQQMTRAQIFAFGTSSSMATLPVVIDCINQTGKVSKTLTNFVMSLGATIGMDGAALIYPIATVFMAEAEGIGHIIGGVEYFLIIIVSTIGAVGAGPVPSAGGVMIMTIWSSVFPSTPLPSTFAFYIATDWFIDRFQTVVNVMDDTVVCRIIAERVGETLDDHEDDELDEERKSVVLATAEITEGRLDLQEALSVHSNGETTA